jgi:predicted phage baseplate assembly protein
VNAAAAPPVVPAQLEDFSRRTAGLVEEYTGVRPAQGTPAGAMVEIFARFAEVVAERLNRAPDRNFVAFLDLLGLELLPPQPARAPVTFSLAGGTPGDALVPAGTQVAALPLGAEKDPVVFETLEDLVATRTELALAFTRDPLRDAYGARQRVLAGGSGPAAPLFEGELPVRHLLYLSFTDLAVKGPKRAVLAISPSQADVPWPRYVQWSTFDGTAWQPLASTWNGERWEVAFDALDAVTASIVEGRAEPWIRGSFPLPLRRAPAPPLATVAGGAPFAGAAAPAFGPSGTAPLALCLGAVPAGAQVRLAFEIGAKGNSTEVVWEYSSAGGGWTELGRSRTAGSDGAVTDDTAALNRSGALSFAAPGDWEAATLNGASGQCLRARPAPASFGGAAPVSPTLLAVYAGYELRIPPVETVTARIEMQAADRPVAQAFANQAPVDLTKDFFPFGERPRFGDTFYFTVPDLADKPGAAATLHVALSNPGNAAATPAPAGPVDLALRWEFWNAASGRWELLGESGTAKELAPSPYGLADPTNGFSVQPSAPEPARIAFTRPPELGDTEVNGVRGTWLRVRITGGGYGSDSTYRQVKGEGDKPDTYTLVPATYRPPSVRSVSLSYVHASTPQRPLSAVTENDFEVVDRTAAAVSPAQTFVPFAATDGSPALYLGFRRPGADAAFGPGAVTLYFGLEETLYASDGLARLTLPPSVVWEFRDGRGWSYLDVRDGTQGFTRRGTVTFTAPPALRLSSEFGEAAYWLRARLDEGGYAAAPQVRRVLTNTTWAVQRESIRDEVLGSSNGERSQAFRTARTPILAGAVVEVREPTRPSGPEADQLAREEGPGAVREVPDAADDQTEIWVRWHRVADFLGSEPRSRHYTLDWATGEVRFGDGVRGMIPPQGRSNVRAAHYEVGGGPQGNRPAENLAQLKSTVPYVDKAVNPEPAAGGSSAETMDALRVRGPRTLRHRDRAVAASDFEDLAMAATTEVARAWAVTPDSLASAGGVELLIVPRSGDPKPVPSVELLERVKAFVGARTPPTVALAVAGPRWLSVSVQAEVVAATPEAARGLPDAIAARIDAFLHPLDGGPYAAGWELGRRPYRSELFSLIEGDAAVDHLRSLRVTILEDGKTAPPDDFTRDRLLVYPGTHVITVAGSD